MKKRILIDAHFPTQTRVVLLNKNNNIETVEYSSISKKQIKGNIYLAKVTRVEPSLQAAFIDYGDDKSGFLPFSEIHSDYYNILARDKDDQTLSWDELNPPEITSDDLSEMQYNTADENNIIDHDDIDINKVAKLIDEKIPSQFELDVAEHEVEKFSKDENNIHSKKNYKIQEAIKKGQILLVQATKDERGNKGASFTTHISLAGKYCVLMPNKAEQNGVSRKISSYEERKRLKEILSALMNDQTKKSSSVIARTAGIGHTSLEIKKDYEYLARLWNRIREATLKSKAPCFIHQEDGLILKTIRDMFDRDVKEVIVQGSEAFKICVKFVQDIMPNALDFVREYKQKIPIFTKFNVEDQLTKLYQPSVSLPSGGYIVINPTEALISIDVNSGKATGERNVEETALKTNLEAAREIARQAKLRDLSGLLVIDFIDMLSARNRKMVERSLREFLSKDKARIQTNNISSFGLLEMSRQRMRASFLEINSNICAHCSGKGIVRADEPNAMLILRTIENEIFDTDYDIINVYSIASSTIYLLNNKRVEIDFIEKKYSIKLNFIIDDKANSDSYSIEKIKLLNKHKKDVVEIKPALQEMHEEEKLVKSKEEAAKITAKPKQSKSRKSKKKATDIKQVDEKSNIQADKIPEKQENSEAKANKDKSTPVSITKTKEADNNIPKNAAQVKEKSSSNISRKKITRKKLNTKAKENVLN